MEWLALALFAAVLGPVAGLVGLPEFPLLDRGGVVVAGVGLAVLGVAGTFLTQLAMGDSWRVGVDETEHTELVTAGPFGLVRNPIFTAMLVSGAGIALVVPNVIALLGWVLLLVAIELQVRVVEEPYLRRQHGEPYRRYLATVGRFIPGIGVEVRAPDQQHQPSS